MSDETNTNGTEDQSAAVNSETPVQASGKENTYFFKTPTVKDAEGKEIGKGTKHPDVKVMIPVDTDDEIISYMAAPDGTPEARVRDMIRDALFELKVGAGRRQINEFLEQNYDAATGKWTKQFAATDLDLSRLTLQAIADTPKAQRGAWAPDEEDFKSFVESYTNVLVHKTGYDPKKTATHCGHWKTGMAKVKTDKPVVAKLKDFLTIYAANVEEADMEENSQTYGWLLARANKYLTAEEKDYASQL